jgi:hypothetical protein
MTSRSKDTKAILRISPNQTSTNKPEVKINKIPPNDFDWVWYLKLNHDLVEAGLSTEGDAFTHWIRWGHRENRPYRKPPNAAQIEREETKNLINILEDNPIDYDAIRSVGIFDLRNEPGALINFIIPVRGRSNFIKKTIESVKIAAEQFKKGPSFIGRHFQHGGVNITVCEHSSEPEHRDACSRLGVDYMWIESKEQFNKCLAMNTAAFFSPSTEWLIFHDIDCIVQSNFFINVFKNIEKKKCKAIQTFSDRRVLYMDEKSTQKILNNSLEIDELSLGIPGIDCPRRPDGSIAFGAPGGSVCITKSLFFKIGGYDPYYFVSYAPEDIFFWLKAEVFETFETCTDPRNEIYHMNHPRVDVDVSKLASMEMLKMKFIKMSESQKIELLDKMNKNIQKYE